MSKYKILLKHHWVKKEIKNMNQRSLSRDELVDMVDLELGPSEATYVYPRPIRSKPMDSSVKDRIRMYRMISSFLIYAMGFSTLCYTGNLITNSSTLSPAKATKASDEASFISRQMTTNLTHEEFMSMLSFDAFLEYVEKQRKSNKHKVHRHAENGPPQNSTALERRHEIGIRAFKERFNQTPAEAFAGGKLEREFMRNFKQASSNASPSQRSEGQLATSSEKNLLLVPRQIIPKEIKVPGGMNMIDPLFWTTGGNILPRPPYFPLPPASNNYGGFVPYLTTLQRTPPPKYDKPSLQAHSP